MVVYYSRNRCRNRRKVQVDVSPWCLFPRCVANRPIRYLMGITIYIHFDLHLKCYVGKAALLKQQPVILPVFPFLVSVTGYQPENNHNKGRTFFSSTYILNCTLCCKTFLRASASFLELSSFHNWKQELGPSVVTRLRAPHFEPWWLHCADSFPQQILIKQSSSSDRVTSNSGLPSGDFVGPCKLGERRSHSR